jgi:hypothetical protein
MDRARDEQRKADVEALRRRIGYLIRRLESRGQGPGVVVRNPWLNWASGDELEMAWLRRKIERL